MAKFTEAFSKMAQTAVAKSRELTEITRLNMDTGTCQDKINEAYREIGRYICDSGVLTEDETVAEKVAQIATLKETIISNTKRVEALRMVNICKNCGAEISRESKFCDKCGQAVVREEAEQPKQMVCPGCAQPITSETVFCGNCGTKCQ